MADKTEGKYLVIFQPSGSRGYIEGGKTLKEASVQLGVDLEGVCGEQAICGTCKVRLEQGDFEKYGIRSSKENLSPMTPSERKFFNLRQEEQGYRLSCQARVQGDLVIFVPEESRMGKQVVRKAPREIQIELKPAVRKYPVEMVKATLEDTLGTGAPAQSPRAAASGPSERHRRIRPCWTCRARSGRGNEAYRVGVAGPGSHQGGTGRVERAYGMAIDVGNLHGGRVPLRPD